MRFSTVLAALGAIVGLGSASVASATAGVQFVSTGIEVAVDCQNFAAPTFAGCGGGTFPNISHLFITVTGHTASVDLELYDPTLTSYTFDIPDYDTPNGYLGTLDGPGQPAPKSEWSPYFTVVDGSLTDVSWNATSYPYVTFWSASDGGGLTIGSAPGETGSDLVTVFAVPYFSTFSVAPEPQTWALMLAGFGLAGAAVRRRGARAA